MAKSDIKENKCNIIYIPHLANGGVQFPVKEHLDILNGTSADVKNDACEK